MRVDIGKPERTIIVEPIEDPFERPIEEPTEAPEKTPVPVEPEKVPA
jgi:hypothetical protein